jgi:hypothetical protein
MVRAAAIYAALAALPVAQAQTPSPRLQCLEQAGRAVVGDNPTSTTRRDIVTVGGQVISTTGSNGTVVTNARGLDTAFVFANGIGGVAGYNSKGGEPAVASHGSKDPEASKAVVQAAATLLAAYKAKQAALRCTQ